MGARAASGKDMFNEGHLLCHDRQQGMRPRQVVHGRVLLKSDQQGLGQRRIGSRRCGGHRWPTREPEDAGHLRRLGLGIAEVEPQQLGWDVQASRVVDEFVQIPDSVSAGLDPAEMTLGDAQPAGEVCLWHGFAASSGVTAIRAHNDAHVPIGQRIVHHVGVPELGVQPGSPVTLLAAGVTAR